MNQKQFVEKVIGVNQTKLVNFIINNVEGAYDNVENLSYHDDEEDDDTIKEINQWFLFDSNYEDCFYNNNIPYFQWEGQFWWGRESGNKSIEQDKDIEIMTGYLCIKTIN